MDVVVWLRSLGLGKYEAAFRENEIDETVLPSLTEEHLKQLGVASLGHRVKPLDAIPALRSHASQETASVAADPPRHRLRRQLSARHRSRWRQVADWAATTAAASMPTL